MRRRALPRAASAFWLALLVASALVVGAPPTAVAQATSGSPPPTAPEQRPFEELLSAWDRTAEAVEGVLRQAAPEAEPLSLTREALERQRSEASALAEALIAQIAPLEAQLAALGPPPEAEAPPEAPEVIARRAQLEGQLRELRARQSQAQLAATRAGSLATRVAELQRRLFAEALLARGPRVADWTIWPNAAGSAATLLGRLTEGAAAVLTHYQPLGKHSGASLALIAVLALAYAVARWVRSHVGEMIEAVRETRVERRRVALAVALAAARAGPPALAALGVAAVVTSTDLFSALGTTLIWGVAQAIALVATARAVARIFFAPRTPTARIINVSDADAARGTRAATAFAAVVGADQALLGPLNASGASFSLMAIVIAVLAMLAGPALFSLARRTLAGPPDSTARRPVDGDESEDEGAPDGDVAASGVAAVRLIAFGIALAIPAAALLGYYALSRYLLNGAAGTAALVAGAGLLYVGGTRLMARPRGEPVESGEPAVAASPGLGPILMIAALSVPVLPLAAWIWGASAADLVTVWRRLLEGVSFGDYQLSLGDIIAAIGVAFLGLWLTRLVQGVLRRSVLPRTSLDQGAQSALTTGVGYLGALLTGLVAISATGIDLSSLAIVAGALSVGIGFGLQAVVSNFVSGVILLIERPIRVGDWIVVGEAQGYVRRINVRATEIETFDRQSVIVPNSELISNQVVNYTHRNLTGRVICQIGVGYDADPDRVMAILRQAAADHPQVLRYPKPLATFAGFGASSLDFELRAFLRDVNWMLSVKSDLNLAILKALRDAEIEIPYPQRDLHLKGLDPTAAAMLVEHAERASPRQTDV